MEINTEKLSKLEKVFLDGLHSSVIDFIRNGSENHITGIVSVSTGAACNSTETQISHVLKSIGLDESYAKGTIRVSFGKDNTIEEAEKIASSLISIISQ